MRKKIRGNLLLVAIRRPIPLYSAVIAGAILWYHHSARELLLTPDKCDASPPAPVPLLDLVGVSSMVLNIGSNVDPLLPKQSAGPCAIGIAFEPIVPHLIREHPQLYVVPAAIVATAGSGMASMYTYNQNGVSSSLSKAATTNEFWNNNKRRKDGKQKFVPTLSLTTLLLSIPKGIDITYIKTDMQGYDHSSVAAGGKALVARGVKYLETETFWKDLYHYQDVHNDLCRDWLPLMAELGYEFDFTRSNEGYCPADQFGTAELAQRTCSKYTAEHPVRKQTNTDTKFICNVMWRLKGVVPTRNTDPYDHPNLPSTTNKKKIPYTYTAEEYGSCFK